MQSTFVRGSLPQYAIHIGTVSGDRDTQILRLRNLSRYSVPVPVKVDALTEQSSQQALARSELRSIRKGCFESVPPATVWYLAGRWLCGW